MVNWISFDSFLVGSKGAEDVTRVRVFLAVSNSNTFTPSLATLHKRWMTYVAYKPRFGGDSQARTSQLVWTSYDSETPMVANDPLFLVLFDYGG